MIARRIRPNRLLEGKAGPVSKLKLKEPGDQEGEGERWKRSMMNTSTSFL
jgi:hypothetical protein